MSELTTVGEKVLWHDDFKGPIDSSGPDARWRVPGFAAMTDVDGILTTSPEGLRVISSGVNPDTGEPAFRRTVAQEAKTGSEISGVLDRVKWNMLPNQNATSGSPGFDAEPGQELVFRARMSARTFGVDKHPYPAAAVPDPQGDIRLANGALMIFDWEAGISFEFMITNTVVYAYHGRLQRPNIGAGTFAYGVPLGPSTPGQMHDVGIFYDRTAGVVRWELDGETVLRLDRIGARAFDRKHMLIDNGGGDPVVDPRQLACGFSLFSWMDGTGPDGRALARLSSGITYYDAHQGEPALQEFIDDESEEGSRIWGQGVELRVEELNVSTRPVS